MRFSYCFVSCVLVVHVEVSDSTNRLGLDDALYAICVFFCPFFFFSYRDFHVLNPNLEFLQSLYVFFFQSEKSLYVLTVESWFCSLLSFLFFSFWFPQEDAGAENRIF